ncbi:MAG: hypothetical protein Q9174_001205 [Haloplaca sp. 1 TL-2023]
MDLSCNPQPPARLPSPTLTDPDMILPASRGSQTTSSPEQTDTPPTLSGWQHVSPADDGQMKSAMRNLLGNGHRLRHKGSEKALKSQDPSDIRPQSKQSELSQRSAGSTLASSPLLHEDFAFKSMANKSMQNGVSDTPEILDDGSVISESASPLVEAEREGFLMSENGGLDGYKFSDRFRRAIVEEDDEAYSHAAMSVRAEEILANAKKRLTEMESNLNRARHTVSRPSSSMSSFNDPQSIYTLPKTLSPSKHRQQHSPPSTSSSKGHSRVFSETSVPSSMQTSPPQVEDQTDDARATSAMGSVGMDPAKKTGSESRDWFWAGLTRNTSHNARTNNYGLQPLKEDGPAPATFESPERQQSPPNVDANGLSPSEEQDLESVMQSSPGLTRARSTNQMRDIRDQMQDLKGKISSLKQRAREDSLRRRSLQSLRTPSPFTAAEQWYAGAPSYSRDRSKSRPREGSPQAVQPVIEEEAETKQYPVQEPEIQDQRAIEANTDEPTEQVRYSSPDKAPVRKTSTPEFDESPRTMTDEPTTIAVENEKPADLEASKIIDRDTDAEDSLELGDQGDVEPTEVLAGNRHEDRPDAFDYEHLFLHSRMGTLGQGGKSRSSSSSNSSDYSVETTKPSNVNTEASEVGSDGKASEDEGFTDDAFLNPRSSVHERKGSVESVSTVATFATATEGDGMGSDTDEDEWIYRRPMAGSWEPEYSSKRMKGNGSHDSQARTKGTKHTVQVGSPATSPRSAANNSSSPVEPSRQYPGSGSATSDLLAFLSSNLPTENAAPHPIELNESDAELAAKLVRSVARVCSQLQAFSTEGNKYGGRPWRRRLDGARRVLDGETNGEVF